MGLWLAKFDRTANMNASEAAGVPFLPPAFGIA
jgi:hypothetical protein